MKTKIGISGFGGKRMRINYTSYAHVIEKGMNKRNMTGLSQVLFKFMCDHEGVLTGRITKKDLEQGYI